VRSTNRRRGSRSSALCCSVSTSHGSKTGSSSRPTSLRRALVHSNEGLRAPLRRVPMSTIRYAARGEPNVSLKTSVSTSAVPTRLRAGDGQRKWVSKPAKGAMILFARAGAAVTVVLLVKSRGPGDAQEVILVPFAIYWTVLAVTLIWMIDGLVRAVRRASRRSAPHARRERTRRDGMAPRVTSPRSRGTNAPASPSGLLRHEGSTSHRRDGPTPVRGEGRGRRSRTHAIGIRASAHLESAGHGQRSRLPRQLP
jgi:hypothetical protein